MHSVILSFVLALLSFTTVWAQTDTTIGITAPGNFGTDVDGLAAALCIDLRTQKEKANAIYNWVTHNIAYDVKGMWQLDGSDDDKVAQALRQKRALCRGYAELYVALCRSAGLEAVTIGGYAKDLIFDNGDAMYIPRHEWCAVKIDGRWELADPTWGAGYMHQANSKLRMLLNKLLMQKKLKAKNLKFKFRYDPQYFMQDPEVFRLRHLPEDPLWQLTDTLMPLTIFEAGDSAVRRFNEISQPVKASPRLDEISKLSETERNLEMADRAYAHNERYHLAMAMKNTILADSLLRQLSKDTAGKRALPMLKDATANMKTSVEYIKKQKKAFPEEYSRLSRKNRAKGMEAKQYIRRIKTDDKRLLAECRKHDRGANNKYTRSHKKLADIQKRGRGLNPNGIDKVKTGKVQKRAGAPELEVINDSVEARNARLDAMLQDIRLKEASTEIAIAESKVLLDSLAGSLGVEDSMLVQEAVARLSMHDSYDDEVKQWSRLFEQQKYQVTDTLMKYYFASFDTVALRYEELQKQYVAALNVHKANVRSLEQYKKLNAGNVELTTRYAATIEHYKSTIDSAARCITFYGNYLRGNRKLFAALSKQGKRQLKIVDHMEKAEKSRQTLEDRTIARKRHTDMKENERQLHNAEGAIRKMQRVAEHAKKK
ncbi:hypothetical protein GCM10023093_00780 [Nemorincola caseinilytica]|uniref:Transglutaminase-like domain-containing protein n=1 Tax=Nemorincola caseinilytica TaxID=2054315 RepID=A0ABP8N464_9BACT